LLGALVTPTTTTRIRSVRPFSCDHDDDVAAAVADVVERSWYGVSLSKSMYGGCGRALRI